jgi:hypothetical protein
MASRQLPSIHQLLDRTLPLLHSHLITGASA